MILYMTDEAHKTELETLGEEVYVKILDDPDMQVMFRQELQQISVATHIIVEAAAIKMDTWETAAASLKTMKERPLLLLKEDAGQTDTFLRTEHYDCMNRAHREIQPLIQSWIQEVENPEFDPAIWNHTWIAVAGLTPGAGTTALAMHLGQYIQQQQQEVAVTERGDVFPQLASVYGFHELAEGSYQWGGVIYNQNLIDETIPYTIFDLGIMNAKSHAIWIQCQVKILVVDGKPYRLKGLGEQLRQLQDYPGEIVLAFTFVPEAEKPAIRKKYISEKIRVWFVPLQPDLFMSEAVYQELVQGYVKPVPEEKKSRKAIPFHLPKASISKKKMMVGGLILIALTIGFQGIRLGMKFQVWKEQRQLQVEVEKVVRMDFTSVTRIRQMLVEEEFIAEQEVEPESGTEQVPEEEMTEVVAESETDLQQEPVSSGPGIQQPGTVVTEPQVPNTEVPTTESPTTEAPQSPGVAAPLTPSLNGYQGQIYTGSQVISIMNKFSGQPVAIHLITRSAEGWYNYSVSGTGLVAASSVSNGTSQVDPQCSFLCQVLRVGGEDVGLEFVQQ